VKRYTNLKNELCLDNFKNARNSREKGATCRKTKGDNEKKFLDIDEIKGLITDAAYFGFVVFNSEGVKIGM
jgi:hypothetical protein